MSMRIGALVLVVGLAAAACGGVAVPTETFQPPGSAPTSGPGGPVEAAMIADFSFSSASITIAAGTTVTWTNQGPSEHTVTSSNGSFPTSQTLNKGQAFSHTFDTPGTFAYVCAIHSQMTGTVTVTP